MTPKQKCKASGCRGYITVGNGNTSYQMPCPNCKPLAGTTPKLPKPPRSSPCAKACKHVWCDGYNTGYEEGYNDGQAEERVDKAPQERPCDFCGESIATGHLLVFTKVGLRVENCPACPIADAVRVTPPLKRNAHTGCPCCVVYGPGNRIANLDSQTAWEKTMNRLIKDNKKRAKR